MLRFVASLFGCPHTHCTFPMTATNAGKPSTTYVVCLDCGQEFPYDWQQMKVVTSSKQSRPAIA